MSNQIVLYDKSDPQFIALTLCSQAIDKINNVGGNVFSPIELLTLIEQSVQ